jgi:uncharacterized protein YdcH (DUF465 family)
MIPTGGRHMFEYEEAIVEQLLKENNDFKRLYNKHGQLKRRVEEVHRGREQLDDFSLENLKKEKLFIKDKMAALIEDYLQTHV